ncbi:MAG: 16S rRNA (guanine(966)-N(2))-methyltransferase RsmD [Spirochaetaceae bacterium]|nr:MAG: 16S rRNA (guanine(966)-N(2))-methyltransferase RsmD [Spirochaetaceae bacterium]
MRITGGTLTGRTVRCPPGEIRPAMDRMRESMFAILGPIDKLIFLDLFSGSCSIGLEAVSRGASRAVCVEKDRRKAQIMKQNAQLAPQAISIVIAPAERFVATNREAFDVIFLDPPFPYTFKVDLIERISDSRCTTDTTRLLIHHPKEDPIPDSVGRFTVTDRRAYGRSIVSFYRAGLGAGCSPTATDLL